MLILDAAEVRKALPMASAVDLMKRAFASLASGKAQVPPRAALRLPEAGGTTLVMPAFVDDDGDRSLAVKVVSVFPGNRDRNLPLIHATVLVIEESTGRPLALMDGGSLTAIRTGAASGAATDLLARPESRALAVLGSGVQARTQLEAVCAVRSIETVRVYDPDAARAEVFVSEMAGRETIPRDVRRAPDARRTVRGADIICAATTSTTPVLDDADVEPGAHINAVGSFQPHVREIPAATVARARVIVDDREAALAEAGDIIQAIEEGLMSRDRIHADLGEVVLGKATGRSSSDQITLFKSVGLAVQDAVAARAVLRAAERAGLGRRVE